MISADKAKRMAKQITENCVSEELSRVETLISEAVKEGRFSVCGEGCMQKATKHELERLGYKVEMGSQCNDSYFSVSWE